MQIVDILRDHCRDLSRPVEACQREMSATWFRGGELRLHGEAPAPCLVAHLLARDELVERDRLVLGPQPARGAKIGDATLGRNSGAGERCDDTRRLDQLLEMVDSGLQIGRDHVCCSPYHFFGRAMQGGHTMRYLHTMLRVRNLDSALDFYCNKLGLKEARRHVDEKNKYTLVFLAAPVDGELVAKGPQGRAAPLVELTYNWDGGEDY